MTLHLSALQHIILWTFLPLNKTFLSDNPTNIEILKSNKKLLKTLSKHFQLTFVDDLLPEKKQQPSTSHSTTNPPTTTSTSRTNYSGASSSTNNVSVMSKPLSKMNTTSNILQQPSNLAGNRNPVDVTNNTRKTTSGNSHTENELKVCNTHVCTQQRTQPCTYMVLWYPSPYIQQLIFFCKISNLYQHDPT